MPPYGRRSISSGGRALDCRAGGRGFDSWGRTKLRVLKKLRNEATTFALQMARPSRGSDDHVKWQSRLQWETENSVPSWYFRAKYIDTQIKCIFLHELVEICNKAAPKFP